MAGLRRSLREETRRCNVPPLAANAWLMLVSLLAFRAEPADAERRFGIAFQDHKDNGLGWIKVARIVVDEGDEYILSCWPVRRLGVLVEGWIPPPPGPCGSPRRPRAGA